MSAERTAAVVVLRDRDDGWYLLMADMPAARVGPEQQEALD